MFIRPLCVVPTSILYARLNGDGPGCLMVSGDDECDDVGQEEPSPRQAHARYDCVPTHDCEHVPEIDGNRIAYEHVELCEGRRNQMRKISIFGKLPSVSACLMA